MTSLNLRSKRGQTVACKQASPSRHEGLFWFGVIWWYWSDQPYYMGGCVRVKVPCKAGHFTFWADKQIGDLSSSLQRSLPAASACKLAASLCLLSQVQIIWLRISYCIVRFLIQQPFCHKGNTWQDVKHVPCCCHEVWKPQREKQNRICIHVSYTVLHCISPSCIA